MMKRIVLAAAMTGFTVVGAHAGINEDSYIISRDDRGVVSCYQATYYEAKYRVDPKGYRVSRSGTRYVGDGDFYRLTRNPAVYVEKRTRIKEDYVSLRRVPCD